jgi:hypothetical protein
MVRDGLLSPNSKLLPESERPFSSDFRGSMYSVASSSFNLSLNYYKLAHLLC